MRVSTIVLIVAFVALFWVYHNFEPRPAAPEAPPTAVVPPGFVPDPNYTWVPRTNVRRPKEDVRPLPPRPPPAHRPRRRHQGRPPARRRRRVHTDDNRRQGQTNQPDANPHTDDPAGARVGTGADDAGSAEIALSGFRPRHRYTGVP